MIKSILILALLASSAVAQVTVSATVAKGYIPKKDAAPVEIISEPYPPTIYGMEFNEGSGTTLTATTGPNATISGGTWITGASGSGSAYDSDGDTTFASGADLTYGVNVVTVTFWTKATSWATSAYLIQSRPTLGTDANMWRVFNDGDAIFYFTMAGTTASVNSSWSIPSPSINTWHHVAVVFNASTATGSVSIYLNGVLQSPTVGDQNKDGTSNFTTDAPELFENASLDVSLDDVRIYSGALSAAQIYQIYLHPR